jgi:hypothetical protein
MTQLISFTLDEDTTEYEINTDSGASEPKLNMQSSREFVIGGNSVFDGATFTIEKYLSDNTGYTTYVNPSTQSPVIFTSAGAGYGITFYDKVGKIKFVLEGATANTVINIDLIK